MITFKLSLSPSEHAEVSEKFGFETIKGTNGWVAQKGSIHIWLTASGYTRAINDHKRDRYWWHKTFTKFEDALKNTNGLKFGPAWKKSKQKWAI